MICALSRAIPHDCCSCHQSSLHLSETAETETSAPAWLAAQPTAPVGCHSLASDLPDAHESNDAININC